MQHRDSANSELPISSECGSSSDISWLRDEYGFPLYRPAWVIPFILPHESPYSSVGDAWLQLDPANSRLAQLKNIFLPPPLPPPSTVTPKTKTTISKRNETSTEISSIARSTPPDSNKKKDLMKRFPPPPTDPLDELFPLYIRSNDSNSSLFPSFNEDPLFFALPEPPVLLSIQESTKLSDLTPHPAPLPSLPPLPLSSVCRSPLFRTFEPPSQESLIPLSSATCPEPLSAAASLNHPVSDSLPSSPPSRSAVNHYADVSHEGTLSSRMGIPVEESSSPNENVVLLDGPSSPQFLILAAEQVPASLASSLSSVCYPSHSLPPSHALDQSPQHSAPPPPRIKPLPSLSTPSTLFSSRRPGELSELSSSLLPLRQKLDYLMPLPRAPCSPAHDLPASFSRGGGHQSTGPTSVPHDWAPLKRKERVLPDSLIGKMKRRSVFFTKK